MPVSGWAVINPSPTARTDLVTLDVIVEEGRPLAFSSGDSALQAQELPLRDSAIATYRLRGDAIPELLRRRRHRREFLGMQINAIRIDRSEPPRITMEVDDVSV